MRARNVLWWLVVAALLWLGDCDRVRGRVGAGTEVRARAGAARS